MPSIRKVLKNSQAPEYEILSWTDFQIGIFLSPNKSDRRNEDSLFIAEHKNSLILGVADGAGGHPRGDLASNTIAETMSKFKGESILTIVNAANSDLKNLKIGGKSTLSGAYLGDYINYFSAGDSEIIHWNSNGTELYSNIPDSSTGHLVEAGEISQEESLDDPDRYMVNNLMGDIVVRVETTTEMEIKKGHSVLIGSDGLFDNFSHSSLKDICTKGSFEDAFNLLVDKCINQDKDWRKDDDISFIMLRRLKNKAD